MSKVTIYTTPTCAFCHAAKEWLEQKQIDFEEIDVSQNQGAAEEMVQRTDQMGVPVIFVGDQYVIGFDQAKLEEALENA